jgi:hypothetical protein
MSQVERNTPPGGLLDLAIGLAAVLTSSTGI